jgi:hypothetical protein
VLSPDQRAEFERWGVLKLDGVFTADEAARMQAVAWGELHRRYRVDRDDPSTWDRHPPTGMKSTKKSRAFAPILGPTVAGALDDLFGAHGWTPPKTFGNVLVTMPDATAWRVPHKIWHSDFPATFPIDELFAVKLWSLFDDVEPGGGGTPQLAGSHALFARYLRSTDERDYKRTKFGFLRSHPWLRALTREDDDEGRNERFSQTADIDGLPARVLECTGKAGDVYVTHPWVFHSIAVNATDRPRFMRSTAVWRRPEPVAV